jgi:CO/xanthine dehydrogenase FAD-binding subunit
MAKFDYFAPADLAEAVSLLNYGEEAEVIAGGRSLILIRQGLIRPEVLISLHRIPALRQIELVNGHIEMGAMATQREVQPIKSDFCHVILASKWTHSCAKSRYYGRNISHAEPNGDSAPALISLGASVVAASHEASGRFRWRISSRPFENCLPTRWSFAFVLPCQSWCFQCLRQARQRAVDRATVGIGLQVKINDAGVCEDARVAGAPRRHHFATPRRFSKDKNFICADGCRRSGSFGGAIQ